MPILNGLEATRQIRLLEVTKLVKTDRLAHLLEGGRILIFAVSTSLVERQREELEQIGIDGWILKPIGFERLYTILRGVTDPAPREPPPPSPLSDHSLIRALSIDRDGTNCSTAATAGDNNRV